MDRPVTDHIPALNQALQDKFMQLHRLRREIEDPLEPDLPICDPHHHVWDLPNSRYLLDQILQDMGGGHNIVSTVFLECSWAYREDGPEALRPVGETEYVDHLAAQTQNGPTAVAAGIVGFAELSLGEKVIPALEAHLAASPDRFQGIRRSTAADASPDISSYKNPPPGLLMNATFRKGFACLQRYDLSFDAGVYHTQLPELADLARAFPEQATRHTIRSMIVEMANFFHI